MSQIATRISIYADDRASSAFRAVGREAESLESLLSRLGPGLKTALAGLGAGVGLSEALQQASAYETAVVNMARVTDRSFAQVKADVAGLGPDLGTQTQLMQGYYAVMSAGVTESAAALDLLTTASKGSKAAGVTLSQTITALTKLMAGYAGEIRSATEASDLLFTIEKQGQTTFAELVPVIGDAAAISKQAGVSADEMGATLAAITQTAGGTSQAVTQYRAVLTSLIKPQQTMRALLANMGYASGVALVQEKGLAGAIMAVQDAANKAGAGMGTLFESSEALTALGPLLASDFARVTANMEAMRAKSGATSRAFENWKSTLAGLKETTANLFADLTMSVGNIIAPAAAEALRDLNAALSVVRNNFDTVTTAAGALATGYVAMTAAQKLFTSETIRNATATASLEWAQARGKLTILDSAKALAQKALAEVTAAKAQRDATAAALAKFKAEQAVAVATRDAAQAAIIRAAQEKQLAALTGAATAAEARYTAAVTATTAATARASVAGRAWAGVRASASGLVGLMGGPWVAGFTVAAGAVAYLSMRETEGERIAKAHASSIEDLRRKMDEAATATSGLAREQVNLNASLQSNKLHEYKNQLEELRKDAGSMAYPAKLGFWSDGAEAGGIREFQNLLRAVGDGSITFAKAREEAGKVFNAIEAAGKASERFRSVYVAAFGEGSTLEAGQAVEKDIADLTGRVDALKGSMDAAGDSATSLSAALALLGKQEVAPAANLESAIKALREYTKTTKAAKDEAAALQRQAAEANLAVLKQAADDARASGRTDNAQKLNEEYERQKARIPQVGAKSNSGSGASRADSARRSLQALDAEIEKLKGAGESFDIQLAKKLAEIAKTGKDAGLSLDAVTAKQKAYSEAANADNQRRYNEALRDLDLSLAQLSGDLQQVRALEAAKEVEELTRKFSQFGPVTEEAAAKIEALAAARLKQSQVKEASAAAGFYKELYEKAGLFGAAQDYNNELLRLQGENLKQNVGISQEYVDQWIKLQQIESSHEAFDGARRGLVKFGSEYGDVAKQIESTTQSMGNTISSTLADAFMNGEFSAKKFFNSLLSMAVQGMSNALVGQLFSGLGGLFGAGVAHAGGVIGQSALPTRAVPPALFADAPRYHRGGPILAADEVPIIAQRGERVLTREQAAAWERGRAAAPVALTVRLENKSGQSLQASQSQTQWSGDMRSAVVTIVLDAVQRNYMGARDALKG